MHPTTLIMSGLKRIFIHSPRAANIMYIVLVLLTALLRKSLFNDKLIQHFFIDVGEYLRKR